MLGLFLNLLAVVTTSLKMGRHVRRLLVTKRKITTRVMQIEPIVDETLALAARELAHQASPYIQYKIELVRDEDKTLLALCFDLYVVCTAAENQWQSDFR